MVIFRQCLGGSKIFNSKKLLPRLALFAGGTLVSFTQKDETIQNAKTPKKIAKLTLIDALMYPKT